MFIRKYKSEDCKQLAELFYETVHCINAKDYTSEQLYAWASGSVDLEKWDKSFLEHYTLVALEILINTDTWTDYLCIKIFRGKALLLPFAKGWK